MAKEDLVFNKVTENPKFAESSKLEFPLFENKNYTVGERLKFDDRYYVCVKNISRGQTWGLNPKSKIWNKHFRLIKTSNSRIPSIVIAPDKITYKNVDTICYISEDKKYLRLRVVTPKMVSGSDIAVSKLLGSIQTSGKYLAGLGSSESNIDIKSVFTSQICHNEPGSVDIQLYRDKATDAEEEFATIHIAEMILSVTKKAAPLS